MVSYLIIILLWSGVGGPLFDHHVAVVRGWWSTVHTIFRRTLAQLSGKIMQRSAHKRVWQKFEGNSKKALKKNRESFVCIF